MLPLRHSDCTQDTQRPAPPAYLKLQRDREADQREYQHHSADRKARRGRYFALFEGSALALQIIINTYSIAVQVIDIRDQLLGRIGAVDVLEGHKYLHAARLQLMRGKAILAPQISADQRILQIGQLARQVIQIDIAHDLGRDIEHIWLLAGDILHKSDLISRRAEQRIYA